MEFRPKMMMMNITTMMMMMVMGHEYIGETWGISWSAWGRGKSTLPSLTHTY
jgi:hypothetical protein